LIYSLAGIAAIYDLGTIIRIILKFEKGDLTRRVVFGNTL
jgi:hypothetical protein